MSPPLESEESHVVLIIEMTLCYWGIKKKSKPGLYFYLTTNCMEGNTRAPLFFLNVSVLC